MDSWNFDGSSLNSATKSSSSSPPRPIQPDFFRGLGPRTLFSIWGFDPLLEMGLVVLFLGDVSLFGSEGFLFESVELEEIFEVELSFLNWDLMVEFDDDVGLMSLVLFLGESDGSLIITLV